VQSAFDSALSRFAPLDAYDVLIVARLWCSAILFRNLYRKYSAVFSVMLNPLVCTAIIMEANSLWVRLPISAQFMYLTVNILN